MSNIDFLRDPHIDAIILDIIEIFTKIEGVKLVRLSGITLRSQKISGKFDITTDTIDSIINKLNGAQIIKFNYTICCPHCGEKSYIIIADDDFKDRPKLCDTCNSFYTLNKNINFFEN